jgi:hypothetical protein
MLYSVVQSFKVEYSNSCTPIKLFPSSLLFIIDDGTEGENNDY